MDPVSVADFTDHWRYIMAYGNSPGSGAQLALNSHSIALWLHELWLVT